MWPFAAIVPSNYPRPIIDRLPFFRGPTRCNRSYLRPGPVRSPHPAQHWSHQRTEWLPWVRGHPKLRGHRSAWWPEGGQSGGPRPQQAGFEERAILALPAGVGVEHLLAHPAEHRSDRLEESLVLGPVPDGVLAGQIRLLGLGQDIKPEEDILPFGNRCHGDGVAVDGHVEPRGWGWGVLSRTARSESSFSDDASLGVTSWTRRAI